MKAFIKWYKQQEPAKQAHIEEIINCLMVNQQIEAIMAIDDYRQTFNYQPDIKCRLICEYPELDWLELKPARVINLKEKKSND